MSTCSTCKYWEKHRIEPNGTCDAVNCVSPDFTPDKKFELELYAADDWGLEGKLITGPNFGCVLHKER